MNKFLGISSLILKQTSNTSYDIKDLRKVISFSLYGNVEKYIEGLSQNSKQINKVYPDFWIYVYLGNDFDKRILDNKFNDIKNLLFIETGKSGHEVMSYRFFTIDRPEVGISFSRDLDSLINLRDQYCINEFLKSDKKFQIIRDCQSHKTEILGGMWGIKKGLLNFNIEDRFALFKKESKLFQYGTDQQFLTKYIYPIVVNESLVFDEYFKFPRENPQKINAPIIYFPTTKGYDYVGRCANWGEIYEII
jgi:hypothetical protein